MPRPIRQAFRIEIRQVAFHACVDPCSVEIALGFDPLLVAQVVEVLDIEPPPILQEDANILCTEVDWLARGVEGRDGEEHLGRRVVPDREQHNGAGWPVRHHGCVSAREPDADVVIACRDHAVFGLDGCTACQKRQASGDNDLLHREIPPDLICRLQPVV